MTAYLLLAAVIIIVCVLCSNLSAKIGIPMLLAFLLLGMLFGSDGIFKIEFDDFSFAEQICSVALLFIMFYGGFGTNWRQAKKAAAKGLVLSALGTVLTAGLVGLFCHFVLKIALLESFLIGAVLCSTDAASVFSILRSKRLNLRDNTASLLEIESGSNDPVSYMLTVLLLTLMSGEKSGGEFWLMLISQIGFGLLFGFAIAGLTLLILKKIRITSAGFSAIFIVAVAVISYAAPTLCGGNGYLSAYITGIILGNSKIGDKPELVHFFDGLTGLMQVLLFFLLGLLAFPSQMPAVALTSLFIALFLTFAARPLAVFLLLSPFKCRPKQQLLVSWAGMRGAASIVFAILVKISPVATDNDVLHIVYFIVVFSILLQGTLLPFVAEKLKMTDDSANVMRTFNDYMDEVPVQFLQFTLPPDHDWVGKPLREAVLPPSSLIVLLTRGGKKVIPNGATVLQSGDTLILSGAAADHTDGLRLCEKQLAGDDEWNGKRISEIVPKVDFILLIKRADRVIIPKGETVLHAGDVLVITDKTSPA